MKNKREGRSSSLIAKYPPIEEMTFRSWQLAQIINGSTHREKLNINTIKISTMSIKRIIENQNK